MQNEVVQGFRFSPQQRHLWLMQQSIQNQPYRALCLVQLEGKIDTYVLQMALEDVVSLHEILRTTFRYLPGMTMPLQFIDSNSNFAFPTFDLESLVSQKQEAQVAEIFREVSQAPFDFECGSLLYSALMKLSKQKHLLLISLPALCSDAVTLKNLMQEVSSSYEALFRDERRTDEQLQYADLSEWLNESLQEEDASARLAYWDNIDWPQALAVRLPFENQSSRQGYPGQSRVFAPLEMELGLDDELCVQIITLAQLYHVSLDALVLTCWLSLLCRFTSQSHLVIGVACDGRHYEELSNTLGLYTRTVPVSTDSLKDLSLKGAVMQIHTSLNEAIKRQEYFAWEQVSLPINAGQESHFLPLSFEFLSWPSELMVGGLRGTLLRLSCCSEPFALKLTMMQVGSRLRLQMHYDPRRFSPEQIATLSRSFKILLQQAFVSPQTALGTLPLLNVAEQQRLIHRGRGPEEPAVFQGLIQRFEAQVVRHPQRLAARCGEETLSYQELEWQSNQLARALCAWGIEPGMLVALYLERSLLHLVALLAVLKVGAGYVPLDPEQPVARIQAMLDELPDGWLVTQEQLQGRLNGRAGRCLCLDGPAANWREETKNPLDTERAPDPEEIAYVIYTSGSTGAPKGVMIRQGSVSNYIQAMCAKVQAQPGWQWASVSTLAADLGNTLLFGALASGGGIHLVPGEVALHGEALGQYLRTQQIDVLKLVPSHLSAVLESGLTAGPRQWLLLGGEALRVELVQRVRELGGTCRVMNHYGPTESTIGAVVEEVGALESVPAWEELVPIGRPIANLRGSVLDERQQVVPVGMVGELYLGGAGLGRGYLGRPEQTAERWVPDPYGEEEGARLYRTGDRVRAREDGRLEYVGRSDRQVKLRGYRIELGEIEAVLKRHPAVQESVVVVREEDDGKQRLVAYVVQIQKSTLSVADLRSYLQENLPMYMQPSFFVILESLPLTSNGKLDRRALIESGQIEQGLDETFVLPATPVEKVIAGIWMQVLGVERVGVYDNFFALGGHSLLATQVILRIHRIFQVQLPLHCLFDVPTIGGLVNELAQARGGREIVEEIAQIFREIEQLTDDEIKTYSENEKGNA